MKIGILADTHNNIDNTRWALDQLQAAGAERLLHCGDLTTPQMIEMFRGWDVAFVFGNMDTHNRDKLKATAASMDGMRGISQTYTDVIDGVRVAMCHGHEVEPFREFTQSGDYDLVCYEHTHTREDRQEGRTRIVNPGALGSRQVGNWSCAVFDTQTGELRFILRSE